VTMRKGSLKAMKKAKSTTTTTLKMEMEPRIMMKSKKPKVEPKTMMKSRISTTPKVESKANPRPR